MECKMNTGNSGSIETEGFVNKNNNINNIGTGNENKQIVECRRSQRNRKTIHDIRDLLNPNRKKTESKKLELKKGDDISKNGAAQICNEPVKSCQKDKTKTNFINNKNESNMDLISSKTPTTEKRKSSEKKVVRVKRKESQEKNKEPINILKDGTNLYCDGKKSSTSLTDINSGRERSSDVGKENKSKYFSKKNFQKNSDEVEVIDLTKECDDGIFKPSVLSARNIRQKNRGKNFIAYSLRSEKKQSKILGSDMQKENFQKKDEVEVIDLTKKCGDGISKPSVLSARNIRQENRGKNFLAYSLRSEKKQSKILGSDMQKENFQKKDEVEVIDLTKKCDDGISKPSVLSARNIRQENRGKNFLAYSLRNEKKQSKILGSDMQKENFQKKDEVEVVDLTEECDDGISKVSVLSFKNISGPNNLEKAKKTNKRNKAIQKRKNSNNFKEIVKKKEIESIVRSVYCPQKLPSVDDIVKKISTNYQKDEVLSNQKIKTEDHRSEIKCDIEKFDSFPNIKKEKDFPTFVSDDFQDSSRQLRRSNRIKAIIKVEQCVGRGLVKDRERVLCNDDKNQSCATTFKLEAENEKFRKDLEERLSQFQVIQKSEYRCDRVINKETKKMICDCFLTRDEEERGELGCGEDCLNRLLMIECGPKCPVASRCTNKQFQNNSYSHCTVFSTEKKGLGIKADSEILLGEFIMEYVGEVLNDHQFKQRAETYSKDKNKHYYFMALRSDAIIDATVKGNISRFINHSCSPNAKTEKWTVDGELRIGFFSIRNICPGEEITFDYRFQRYGELAQRCYCESANCRGWIGEEPDSNEEYKDEADGISEEDEERDRTGADLEKKSSDISDKSSDLGASSIIYGDLREDVDDGNESPINLTTPVRGKAGTRESKKSKQRKEFRLGKKSQFLEDQDVEDEIESLTLTGLKNRAHTLRLSRLMVRVKTVDTRIRVLEILRGGDLPCRRLFLDYHGLELLHGWMNENEVKDNEASLRLRLLILQTLEILPITNKTQVTKSKVFYIITSWAEEKGVHSCSPNPDSPTGNGSATLISVADQYGRKEKESASVIPQAVQPLKTEIHQISKKLFIAWDDLPEMFRIPKRETIEQMKEHEREADRQYNALYIADEDKSKLSSKCRGERFCKSSKTKAIKTEWTGERDEQERYIDADASLTKVQRRELFEARAAKDAEERRDFEEKCKFFGFDSRTIQPRDIPFCVCPETGEWYTKDKQKIETPPIYEHNVPQTDTNHYHLPPMNLPSSWRFEYDSVDLIDANDSVDSDESVSDTNIIKIEPADEPVSDSMIENNSELRDRKRKKRYQMLVQDIPICPRREEDRVYYEIHKKICKENKEKILKRREELQRKKTDLRKQYCTASATADGAPLPIADYLLSSDDEDRIGTSVCDSSLLGKFVKEDKILEPNALKKMRPLKRSLPIKAEHQNKKQSKFDDRKRSKDLKINKDINRSDKTKEKFRRDITEFIAQNLKLYQTKTCLVGKNATNEYLKKLIHIITLKEAQRCNSTGKILEVTESVKEKSRRFIKKYISDVIPRND